jgi:hypothetical protein
MTDRILHITNHLARGHSDLAPDNPCRYSPSRMTSLSLPFIPGTPGVAPTAVAFIDAAALASRLIPSTPAPGFPPQDISPRYLSLFPAIAIALTAAATVDDGAVQFSFVGRDCPMPPYPIRSAFIAPFGVRLRDTLSDTVSCNRDWLRESIPTPRLHL